MEYTLDMEPIWYYTEAAYPLGCHAHKFSNTFAYPSSTHNDYGIHCMTQWVLPLGAWDHTK